MAITESTPLGAVYATRRANLRALAGDNGLKNLGKRLGYSPAYMSQLAGVEPKVKREITEKTARAIETKLGLVFGWLDMQRAA